MIYTFPVYMDMDNLLLSSNTYRMVLAGIEIDCLFCFPETATLFGKFILGQSCSSQAARIPDAEWRQWVRDGGRRNAQAEFASFTACASDALLQHNRAIIHAVAFRFRDRAWLICAGSGVGKSTQIRSLQELFPEQFSVICGDRPVLEFQDNERVVAHPSPWNGKEGWHNAEAAPLAGILCLERGKSTALTQLSANEAVIPVFKSLISTFGSEETVHRLAAFETELLNRVPVWLYVNGGVPDSAQKLYEQVLSQV